MTTPPRIFVDANVFLRFFTLDDQGQTARAERLFKRAKTGEVTLVTGPPVLFELAWTLRSAYAQTKAGVVQTLSAILALPNLELTDRRLVDDAVALTRSSGQEFADAYIAASLSSAGAGELATFNRRHFGRLGTPLHAL